MTFCEFHYEPLAYQGATDAFRLIARAFTNAATYLNYASSALSQIHSLWRGVIYGCEPTISGHQINISDGLVMCDGLLHIPACTIGIIPNTKGLVVIGVDGIIRCVPTKPDVPHVILMGFTSDGNTLAISLEERDVVAQITEAEIKETITGISIPEGITRIYTIEHDTYFVIPGYVTCTIDDGFIAVFLQDTEQENSFQVAVTQIDQEAPPATLHVTRTGLAIRRNWYA